VFSICFVPEKYPTALMQHFPAEQITLQGGLNETLTVPTRNA